MKKTVFVTFCDRKFKQSLQLIKKEAYDSQFFDEICAYDETKLERNYWERIKHLCFENPRGFGYWIWKSYIVKKEIDRCNDGDYLVYLDGGCRINKSGRQRFEEYKQMLTDKHPIACFGHNNCYEKQYNKMDLLEFLGLQENEEILNAPQIMSGGIIIYVCDVSRKLIGEWFDISQNNYHLLTDSPSKNAELPSFIEHRHDQSILSLLLKKHDCGLILPQDEFWHCNDDWTDMTRFPFWATRRKRVSPPSILERIRYRIRILLKI